MPRNFEIWRAPIHLASPYAESLSALPDGRFIETSWGSRRDGSITESVRGELLIAKFVDPFGTAFASSLRLGGTTFSDGRANEGWVQTPDSIVLTDGRILFSWSQAMDSFRSAPAVHNRLYDPVTHAVSTPYGLSQGGNGGSGVDGQVPEHEAVQLRGGSIVQVADWIGGLEPVRPGESEFALDITLAVFTPDGTVQGTGKANSTTLHAQTDPAVAALGDGFFVAWTDRSQTAGDVSGTAVRGRAFTANASPLSVDFVLNTSTEGDQQKVNLAALPDGGIVAVWESRVDGDAALREVRAQRFDVSGNKVGIEIAVNAATAGNQMSPEVQAFADGSWLVAWLGDDSGVSARYFGADGTPLSGDMRIGSTSLTSSTLGIATAADGRVLVTWDSVNGGSDGVFLDNRPAQMNGTARGEAILGHDAGQSIVDDILVAFAGNDSAHGFAGNDYVYAGAGDDVAVGGVGDDVLLGEGGNDTLYGEDGQDYLYGGGGVNVLLGGGGVDVLISEGSDVLHGGDGGDYLYAYASSIVTAYGGAGNDIFAMQAGPGVAHGGDGQDYFYMGAAHDEMHGGDGVDVLMGQASGGETGEGDHFDAGAGTDYLFLTPGEDTVVMNLQSGVDVVNGFDVTRDVLRLQGTLFTSFDQVQGATTDHGSFCIVAVDANTAVWLIGVAASDLNAGNLTLS
ncbi:MAG TPA: calcium-binding protein [Ramlibacter sp.]|jgi:Ca2+-binding RTX toxin-like protein|nr:calcium-binding protein [Ramlibacter sp.]